jgi:hypothetical protein
MKTKSLLFTALVLMSAVAFGAGKDDPRGTGIAVIPVKGSETFKLIYKGQSAGKVTLNIYSAGAKLIHTQSFYGVDGFICPLNFSTQKAGEYTVELVDAEGKKTEKIVYEKANLLQYVHVSKINNEAGKYLLSVSNNTKGPINVKIYDAESNLIFSETKEVSGQFAQVYKLEAPSKAYSFQVSDNAGNAKTVDFK